MSTPDPALPPQLHLSIPPTTTSFKRSFEQYGFDVDQSPVDNGDNEATESNSNGGQRNERNKRARSSSIFSDGRRTNTTASLSPSHGGLAGSSAALPSGSLVQGATGTIENAISTISQVSTARPSISRLPPRLPTPDMADMEVDIDMLPLDGSNGPHDSLHTASLSPSPSSQTLASSSVLPVPLPLSLSLPNVDLGLDLEGPTEDGAQGVEATLGSRGIRDSLARSLERFSAFDSEMDALRRVSPPPAANPPQLPPLHLDIDVSQPNHHRLSLSSSSSMYSSETSSPIESPWPSQPPMFLDVSPAMFEQPFRGLGVGSDRSATPSSRNSIDGSFLGFTASASTHPPMLPPIATTATTIWEDESPQSPVSVAATIASSSATAMQSVHDEQRTPELNIPEFDALGSPLGVDPVAWFVPDEGRGISVSQPGPPDAASETVVARQADATPRHSQMDDLSFGDDANGEFAALARTFSFAENDDTQGDPSLSLSNIPEASGSNASTSASDVPVVENGPSGPHLQSRFGEDRQSPVLPSLRSTNTFTLPPDISTGSSTGVRSRSSAETAGRDTDTDRLRHLQQVLSDFPSSIELPTRSEESSGSRTFRHPLLHHPHRRPHHPSSLRSSTSLVGESRSERERMRDELDLGLALHSVGLTHASEVVAGSSSSVPSAQPRPSRANVFLSSAERVARLEEEANNLQRQAIEQLNRASELLRSIEQPWIESARARIDAAAQLINANLDGHEPPALQDVVESDDSLEFNSESSDEGDEMEVEVIPTITGTTRRTSASALNEYFVDMEMLRAGDSEPLSFTRAARNVHPFLGHPTRPFIPAPALPSPDFNMDFFRDEAQNPQPRSQPRRAWSPVPRGLEYGPAGAAARSSPPPVLPPPTENLSVSESFPSAIRRAYQDHPRQSHGPPVSSESITATASGVSTEHTTRTATMRGRPPGGGSRRIISNPIAARVSGRDTSSSSTLRSPLALPPGFESLPHRPSAPLTTSILRAQEERPGSSARPSPELYLSGPHHETIRRIEGQRAAIASRQRPAVPTRPSPQANPVQVSAFDLLDRLDTGGPGTSHGTIEGLYRYPFGRPLREQSLAGSSAPPPPRPDGRLSALLDTPLSLHDRYASLASNTIHGRPTPSTGAMSQGRRHPPQSSGGTTSFGAHGHIPGLSPRRDPSGLFDAAPRIDLLTEARERGRRRFGLPGSDDPSRVDDIHRRATTSRTTAQPLQQADRTGHGESHFELRQRLLAMRTRRFNMDDYVSDSDFDASYENLLSLTRDLRRGTPQDILQTMESGAYKDWAKPDSETRCPICLDDYGPDDPVMKLKHCPHWMHRDCIKQWLNGATSCPVCRKSVLESPRAPPSRAIGSHSGTRSAFTPLRSRLPPRVAEPPTPSVLPPLMGRRAAPEALSSLDYIRLTQRTNQRQNHNSSSTRPSSQGPRSGMPSDQRLSGPGPRPPSPGSGGAGN